MESIPFFRLDSADDGIVRPFLRYGFPGCDRDKETSLRTLRVYFRRNSASFEPFISIGSDMLRVLIFINQTIQACFDKSCDTIIVGHDGGESFCKNAYLFAPYLHSVAELPMALFIVRAWPAITPRAC